MTTTPIPGSTSAPASRATPPLGAPPPPYRSTAAPVPTPRSAARPTQLPSAPREALDALMAGNRRWVSGSAARLAQSVRWRRTVADRPSPWTSILACVDSRLPLEGVFDLGVGDAQLARTAGLTLDDLSVAGVAFGPYAFDTPLVLVLGHTRCGAVKAAAQIFDADEPAPAPVRPIVGALRPAYRATREAHPGLTGEPFINEMARTQTRLAVARLRREPHLRQRERDGRLMIVGADYDVVTGTVTVLD